MICLGVRDEVPAGIQLSVGRGSAVSPYREAGFVVNITMGGSCPFSPPSKVVFFW